MKKRKKIKNRCDLDTGWDLFTAKYYNLMSDNEDRFVWMFLRDNLEGKLIFFLDMQEEINELLDD
jgi:hypothetical protein